MSLEKNCENENQVESTEINLQKKNVYYKWRQKNCNYE